MTYKQRQRQLYRIGKRWFAIGNIPKGEKNKVSKYSRALFIPGPTTVRESMLAIGRAEHWLYEQEFNRNKAAS